MSEKITKKRVFSVDVPIPRVMSVQSSVVYGYVGNKAAVLPLQLHGIEVDPLNTCQFANHAGYALCTGSKSNGTEFKSIFDCLKHNKLMRQYSHVMTGYMTNVSCLEETMNIVRELKEENPNRLWVCDPVMGDQGQLYVPEEFVALYRDIAVNLTDVLTPNQTETEVLTGIKINNLGDAKEACRILHSRGPQLVIITSMHLNDDHDITDRLKDLNIADEDFIHIPKTFDSKYFFRGTGREVQIVDGVPTVVQTISNEDLNVDFVNTSAAIVDPECVILPDDESSTSTSTVNPLVSVTIPTTGFVHILASEIDSEGSQHLYYIKVPHYDTFIAGTGDLTTSTLLAGLQSGLCVKKSLEHALGAVQSVLRATLLMKRFELSLVQASPEVTNPSITVTAVEL